MNGWMEGREGIEKLEKWRQKRGRERERKVK